MRKLLLLFSMFAAVAVTSCSKNEDGNIPSNTKEPITIGLSTLGVSYEDLPTSRANASSNLLAAQIYEMNGDVAVPYAKGLFESWSALTFEGYTNTTYKVVATMVVDGTTKLYESEGIYGKPFDAAVASSFEYSDVAFEGLTLGTATLLDGSDYTVPNVDRYFGYVSASVTADSPSITTTLKRTAFGVTFDEIEDDVTVQIEGAPEVTLAEGEIAIYSFKDLVSAFDYSGDDSYSETMKLTAIDENGTTIYDGDAEFKRNKLSTVTPDGISTSMGFDFETPFEDELTGDDSDEFVILTFEDADYKGGVNYAGASNWSSLIDSPQYGGVMLYGASGYGVTENPYTWTDENNTYLSSTLVNGWGSYCYWSGGHAVSNYIEMDLENGDDQHQLSVYYQDPVTGKGGHNGSDNFCVHYGYEDGSAYALNIQPQLVFADGKEHTIDHMYICNTTYLANVAINGNSLSAAMGPTDYLRIEATGCDLDGNEIGKLEFSLIDATGAPLEGWNKFSLKSLGEISYVKLNVVGSSDNGYGFSQPAYFAFDDVAVIL